MIAGALWGIGEVAAEVLEYLRHGRWQLEIMSTAEMFGWHSPSDWFGLWKILNWVPAPGFLMCVGAIFLISDELD